MVKGRGLPDIMAEQLKRYWKAVLAAFKRYAEKKVELEKRPGQNGAEGAKRSDR
jgi:hypothetical protein